MLVMIVLLAAVALGLAIGFAALAVLLLRRGDAQQGELAALRCEMQRLLGDAEAGELTAILRHLHAAQKDVDEARAERRRADARYVQLDEDTRRERDWQRAFERDR